MEYRFRSFNRYQFDPGFLVPDSFDLGGSESFFGGALEGCLWSRFTGSVRVGGESVLPLEGSGLTLS